jgi:hypothetical protein
MLLMDNKHAEASWGQRRFRHHTAIARMRAKAGLKELGSGRRRKRGHTLMSEKDQQQN